MEQMILILYVMIYKLSMIVVISFVGVIH
jgi:hypothetical protein